MTETVKLTLKTLAPVHIGSGAEISPSEYWYDSRSRQVHRLNLQSLTRDPEFAEYLEKFVEGAAQARQIDNYVPKEILARHILYSLPAPTGAHYPIKALVKSGGRVMIPGSSLKGSLLSAVLWKQIAARCEKDGHFREDLRRKLSQRDNRENKKDFEQLVGVALGGMCGLESDRFLQWMNVSDTDLLPAPGNLRVARVEVAGAKQTKIPMLLETIREGVTLAFELAIPGGACRRQKPQWGVQEVLETADAFYRRVWEKTQAPEPAPQGGWLLRLGQGSGAWATSLLVLASDLDLRRDYVVQPPITQKKVDGMTSLGWVLLKPWTPDQKGELTTDQEQGRETAAAAPPAGPSARFTQLLERLKGVKPHDAGQIGMFLDGLNNLEDEEEKKNLAQAVWDHFDRKKLKGNKRFAELQAALGENG